MDNQGEIPVTTEATSHRINEVPETYRPLWKDVFALHNRNATYEERNLPISQALSKRAFEQSPALNFLDYGTAQIATKRDTITSFLYERWKSNDIIGSEEESLYINAAAATLLLVTQAVCDENHIRVPLENDQFENLLHRVVILVNTPRNRQEIERATKELLQAISGNEKIKKLVTANLPLPPEIEEKLTTFKEDPTIQAITRVTERIVEAEKREGQEIDGSLVTQSPYYLGESVRSSWSNYFMFRCSDSGIDAYIAMRAYNEALVDEYMQEHPQANRTELLEGLHQQTTAMLEAIFFDEGGGKENKKPSKPLPNGEPDRRITILDESIMLPTQQNTHAVKQSEEVPVPV